MYPVYKNSSLVIVLSLKNCYENILFWPIWKLLGKRSSWTSSEYTCTIVTYSLHIPLSEQMNFSQANNKKWIHACCSFSHGRGGGAAKLLMYVHKTSNEGIFWTTKYVLITRNGLRQADFWRKSYQSQECHLLIHRVNDLKSLSFKPMHFLYIKDALILKSEQSYGLNS